MNLSTLVTALSALVATVAVTSAALCYTRADIFPLHRRRRWIMYTMILVQTTSIIVSFLRFYPLLMSCGVYYMLIQTCNFGTHTLGLVHCHLIYHSYIMNRKTVRVFKDLSRNRQKTLLSIWAEQNRFRTMRHRLTQSYQQKLLILVNIAFFIGRMAAFSMFPLAWLAEFGTDTCSALDWYQYASALLNVLLFAWTMSYVWRFRKIRDNLFFAQEVRLLIAGLVLMLVSSIALLWTGLEVLVLADMTGRLIVIVGLVTYPLYKSKGHKSLLQERRLTIRQSMTRGNPKEMLINLLVSVSGYELFQTYLVNEASNENLLFWKEVNDLFLDWDKGDKDNVKERAFDIFDTFIFADGTLPINISSQVRQQTMDAFQAYDVSDPESAERVRDALDDCQRHIFRLIQADPFRRFRETEIYVQWLSDQHDDPTGRMLAIT